MRVARRLTLLSIAPAAFIFILAAGWPATAGAQAVADFERKLLPHQNVALNTLDRDFWTALSFLRAEEEKQRALKADIMFGLSGDEAGPKSLFKLNTGISLTRGVFPSELSVVSRFLLQVRDGQLQEEVTSLSITYDYHSSDKFQSFAFAERFTDSFLSIQNRYEIGFGGRIGKDFGFVGNTRVADAIGIVEKQLANVQSAFAAASPTTKRPGDPTPAAAADYAAFRKAARNMEHVVRDSQSRMFIGVAASLFSELERAEMEVTTVPAGGSVTPSDQVKSKVLLPSEQRYRLSVRPTFKFRPSSQVTIVVFPYFKLPLEGPHKVNTPSGRRLDYRRDILSELTWSIRQDQTGLENVDMIFTFNHFYDNVPPALPQSLIDTVAAAGRTFVTTEAERTHRLIALVLRLRW